MKLFNNINTQHIKKALFILVVYIIYIGLFNGYNPYLPSLPFYPNNEMELLEVEKAVANRTPTDVAFFHKTNKSVVEAFVHHVPETREQLTIIETKQKMIKSLKNHGSFPSERLIHENKIDSQDLNELLFNIKQGLQRDYRHF